MNLVHILASPGQDFSQLVEAATLVIMGLVNPYVRLITSSGPFNYPPTSFLILLPFGWIQLLFSQLVAWYVWVIFSLVTLLLGLWICLKHVKLATGWLFVGALILFWFLFFPTKYNFGMGQINTLTLFLLAAGIYLTNYKKIPLATFCLALAGAIKLAPLITIAYFVLRRDWHGVGWYMFWLVVFFASTFLFVPWAWQQHYYFQVFFNAFPLSGKDIYYNQSLLAFLARSLHQPTVIKLAQYLLSCLLVLVTAVQSFRISNNRLWAALVALILLLNPLAWQHHFVLAAIPLIFLAADQGITFWLVVAYLLAAANFARPELIPSDFGFLLSHQFFGALVLWLLAVFPKQEGKVIALLWIILLVVAYILMLLCRAKFCL